MAEFNVTLKSKTRMPQTLRSGFTEFNILNIY